MKTNELTGPALDWAVAMCEGGTGTQINSPTWVSITMPADDSGGTYEAHLHELAYSTDWAQGGPIIEREKITVAPFYERWVAAPSIGELIRDSDGDCMTIAMWDSQPHFYGPTPLIAAMRCYVASKLGDNIDTPKELT